MKERKKDREGDGQTDREEEEKKVQQKKKKRETDRPTEKKKKKRKEEEAEEEEAIVSRCHPCFVVVFFLFSFISVFFSYK